MFARKWGIYTLAQFCYEEIQKPEFLCEFTEWQKKKAYNQNEFTEKQKTAEQLERTGGTNGEPI